MTSQSTEAGQSLLDLTIWLLGDTSRLFDLADANGLGITDPLTPGQVLSIPDPDKNNADLVAYFKQRGFRVNTQDFGTVAPTSTAHDFDIEDFFSPDFDTK
jgi:hypothetical protein